MPSPSDKISIVVVGGGIGGANVARELSKLLDPTRHSLTLITSRQTYVYLPASLRALVNPDFPLATVFMPYDNLFGNFPGNLIHGTVTLIEENKRAPILMNHDGNDVMYSGNVVYRVSAMTGSSCNDVGDQDDEEEEMLWRVPYDVLVVATGSQWEGFTGFPNTTKECFKHIEMWRMKIRDANDIVMAGGGAVGLETAGEIKDIYPDKNVTIVHADRLPLNDIYPDRFRSLTADRLLERNVTFILNDTIQGTPTLSSSSSPTISTRNGTSIPCDLLIPARGGRPSTRPLSFLSPSPLTSRGFISVHSTLQIKHHLNIFALGDIVDWPEIRQSLKIQWGHKSVVVSNVVRVVKIIEDARSAARCGSGSVKAGVGGEKVVVGEKVEGSGSVQKGMRKYKGVSEVILISNGKSCGTTYCSLFGGFMLGDWWTRKLKSRDLMVNTARKGMALGPL